MSIFDHLAEARISRANAQGELSGLPGEGRPLEFEDDCLVPSEVRMTNRILRNAGYVPPALVELRELRALADALIAARGTAEAPQLVRRMTRLLLRVEAAGLSHVSAAIVARFLPAAQKAAEAALGTVAPENKTHLR